MSTASTRTTIIGFSGDVDATLQFKDAANSNSPGESDLLTLASGDNTIAVPTGGSTPVSATIIPPNGNTIALKLKGNAADVGIRLHNTNPGTIPLDSSQTFIMLNAGIQMVGLRIVWA